MKAETSYVRDKHVERLAAVRWPTLSPTAVVGASFKVRDGKIRLQLQLYSPSAFLRLSTLYPSSSTLPVFPRLSTT
jgi:hypothetical protein